MDNPRIDRIKKGSHAAAISLILLTTMFLVGKTGIDRTTVAAYGAMMNDNTGKTMTKQESDMTGNSSMMSTETNFMNYHIAKGQISNVQSGPDGKPDWIQSGIWVLRITSVQNNQVQAQLVARFAMVKPDGTSMHIHTIYGFKLAQFSAEQNNTVLALNGTATVIMLGQPVSDLPLAIKIFNKSVIALWIGPDKVNGHFGSNPIYGILGANSKNMMQDVGSMMMSTGEHGIGNSMITTKMEQNLTKTNIPVSLPLTRGFVNGHVVFYISTEASDEGLATHLTNVTGSRVAFAPTLSNTPAGALANIYAFKNGINGTGPLGFQPNVADSQPGDAGYSPLWRINVVEWKSGGNATELKSEQEITAALNQGKLIVQPTGMIVNCPFILWYGGSVMERSDKNLTDKSPYGPAQVLDINTDKMQVTLVAHRGFASDGSTIYYIATDASNPDVAKALGITFVNKTGATTLSGASSDLFVFTNGIKGTGPMGYQASIASSNIGQPQYSPMWRINAATWKDPSQAKFLTSTLEINNALSDGKLTTGIAGFVVNCPFVKVNMA